MTHDTEGNLEIVKAALLEVDGGALEAELILPGRPKGLVVLAHGSGSSRLSPRNRAVARVLRERGLGTLLVDTETVEEQRESATLGRSSVDLDEMSMRIQIACDWLCRSENVSTLPIGFLGAGTGAAAALRAVAEHPRNVRAIVTRGGRLELVSHLLDRVQVPALLIVGARDLEVVQRNRDALDALGSRVKRMEVVPGAHHFFEEPGALATAAMHAANWFLRHLQAEEEMACPADWPHLAVVRDLQ